MTAYVALGTKVFFCLCFMLVPGFSDGSVVKNLPALWKSVPRLGRFPGGGNGNPLQYSLLENSVGRGPW